MPYNPFMKRRDTMTEKVTSTDGLYFCNGCDVPYEGRELAEACYEEAQAMTEEVIDRVLDESAMTYRVLPNQGSEAMQDLIASMSSIEGLALKRPADIAFDLGMWWAADKSTWGDASYTKEEVLVVEMGTLFLREVFRAMRPQKRERIKKHLRKTLEAGQDYWEQEALDSGHAAKVVASHIEQFNL